MRWWTELRLVGFRSLTFVDHVYQLEMNSKLNLKLIQNSQVLAKERMAKRLTGFLDDTGPQKQAKIAKLECNGIPYG